MKMVFAMQAVFFLAGALTDRISRWTIVGLALAILAILFFTRLSF